MDVVSYEYVIVLIFYAALYSSHPPEDLEQVIHPHATGELGYDGPLYYRLLSMVDDVLGPSPMHIKYVSYVYHRFCI